MRSCYHPCRPAHQSGGFTLIELIIVIVLLGILAAVAIPRFLSATTDARTSAMKELGGVIRTAKNLAKNYYRLKGYTTQTSVDLDGQPVVVLAGSGTPIAVDATGIVAALESYSGFTPTYTAATVTFNFDTTVASCNVVYTPANSPPTDVVVTVSGC